jgi:hypothetical protein
VDHTHETVFAHDREGLSAVANDDDPNLVVLKAAEHAERSALVDIRATGE